MFRLSKCIIISFFAVFLYGSQYGNTADQVFDAAAEPPMTHALTDTGATPETNTPEISDTLGDRKITGQKIRILPGATLEDLIKMQPGIVESELGLHLRGSIENTITYRIDNINMQPSIPLAAIDQIRIDSDVIDVGYDDGLGGSIVLTTRKELQKNTGGLYFSTDRFLSNDRLAYEY
jgi:hypothetical protein